MKRSIALLFLMVLIVIPIHAQATSLQCGDIVEGEFTGEYQQNRYVINMQAGDTISVSGEPIGNTLRFSLAILSPVEQVVATNSTYIREAQPTNNPNATTDVLSARGNYAILVTNSYMQEFYDWNPRGLSGGIGVYTLYISCTLRDGTVINAGDTPPSAEPTNSPVEATPFNCTICFQGIPPVDLSNIARIPMPAGIAMGGAVTATGSEIIGYTFEANADGVVSLDFNRVSGNLNLGLIVLAADNSLIYQASLIASESMNTRLRIPATGTYTIAVYRIDLRPVTNPEATAFQVQATME